MSCCYNGPSKNSIEFQRRFKPENNNGCGCSNVGDCNTPSLALEGSPLWNWEQIYGKLVTTITRVTDSHGHSFDKVEKIPCPIVPKEKSRHGCCSFGYKIVR